MNWLSFSAYESLTNTTCDKHMRYRIDSLAVEKGLTRQELEYVFRRATKGKLVKLEGELTPTQAKEVLRILTEEEFNNRPPVMPKHILSEPTIQPESEYSHGVIRYSLEDKKERKTKLKIQRSLDKLKAQIKC